jgi:hypothetical protein
MKSLKRYIAESVKTYNYTIKIAGEIDKNFLDMFAFNLNKFDPIEISDPVKTPIQKDPYGFPNLSNQPVTIIKAKFRYPANEPMIQQVAQQLGCNINKVRVTTTDYNDSINAESDKYSNEMKAEPLLLQPEMEDSGKEASKDYANQYLDKVVPKRPSIDYMFDAPKTATSPNKSKEGINTQSPMSKITPIKKPLTGNPMINRGK